LSIFERKVRLPTGKEIGIHDILTFCYGLSETDIEVLRQVAEYGEEGTTVDNLVKSLKLSRASISRSLTKLVDLGFVIRRKLPPSGAGRPKYVYVAIAPKELAERIQKDIQQCTQSAMDLIEEFAAMLTSRIKTGKEGSGGEASS